MKLFVLLTAILTLGTACSSQKGEHNMKKTALIVVSSHENLGSTGKKTGWYLSEVTHIYYPLSKAGFDIEFASPKGGAAPMDESSRDLKDPENKQFLEDRALMEKMKTTLALSEVDPKKYQVIHFAGGHGAMWDFAENRDINRVASQIYEQGGIVSAVCHGPAALVNIKLSNGDYLIKGKDVNSFTDSEEAAVGNTKVVPFLLETTLKSRGAKFHAGKDWEDKVVVSERLITGQNPQSGHSVGKKIVEMSQAQ
ncbi:type 1 glutamine amidotransferase domain-containing protein [Peredibacter starrii]|uniref:Type 1 glutamine amidotransferase domain-containing protein n=1 Tax=Peredibacter starrii TaxID=28202 RepID=A0AAX4HMH9_9BACT|nr:type 1 glutamine amidotransferase domain-containing protein [Peredibacter starrii]WPU64552.1 type 1 glutamine amidotransferase domain-containing protein [Peredibacter starrii]